MSSMIDSAAPARPVGDLLREWRQRRRMSQLDLACEADISTKHLSFMETGRSKPSRDMVLHLAERLEVPLRARNTLLNAAGYAPVFPERGLDDPAMTAAREAIDLVLAGHEPHPALAVDRHWCMAAANRAVAPLNAGVDPTLLRPPVNVLRLAPTHPNRHGAADRQPGRVARASAGSVAPADRRVRRSGAGGVDGGIARLWRTDRRIAACLSDRGFAAVAVPFRLQTDFGVLSFFSTTTVFGTPVDITLSELALECFFPADRATADAMRPHHGRLSFEFDITFKHLIIAIGPVISTCPSSRHSMISSPPSVTTVAARSVSPLLTAFTWAAHAPEPHASVRLGDRVPTRAGGCGSD